MLTLACGFTCLGTLFGVLALALIGTQAFVLPRLAQRFSDGALGA